MVKPIDKEKIREVMVEMAHRSHKSRLATLGEKGYAKYMGKIGKNGIEKRWAMYREQQNKQ